MTEHEIITLERRALARWCAGDPSGYLELCAPDVSYFDPFIPRRIDGLPALTAYYEALRGQIRADRQELGDALVQQVGDLAVLSFHFTSWAGGKEMRWSCTEAYRRDAGAWRLAHSHWSLRGPRPGEA